MKVAIRVDASITIGLGHVNRCLSLAHGLREHESHVRFITRRLGIDVKALVGNKGFKCDLLRQPDTTELPKSSEKDLVTHAHWAGTRWDVDAHETSVALQSEPVDWLVIDHYGFDARWHRYAANALSTRIAVIDDLGDRNLAADLLIDHNYAADHHVKYRGRIDENVLILGGPHYALLGPSYAHPAHYNFCEDVRSIGIFMGGVDSGNFSALALRACREFASFSGPIEVITTRDNPHLRTLEAMAATWPQTKITLDLPELSDFFGRHDIQIGAGGGATWERCCIGVPTLAIAVADNQRYVLEPLTELGVVHAITSSLPSAASLGTKVRYLIDSPSVRKRLAQQSRKLVDGRGACRVADTMKKLCTK